MASLLSQLTERAYPVRLIVGTADTGLGSGSGHLLAMLRMLALCERRVPDTGGAQDGESLPLMHNKKRGYTVAVVPWSDQEASASPVQADGYSMPRSSKNGTCFLIELPWLPFSLPPRHQWARTGAERPVLAPSPPSSSSSSRCFALKEGNHSRAITRVSVSPTFWNVLLIVPFSSYSSISPPCRKTCYRPVSLSRRSWISILLTFNNGMTHRHLYAISLWPSSRPPH